jgi:uncharacterized protein YuzE
MNVKYYPEDDLMMLKFSDRPYDYAEKAGAFIIHYTTEKEPVMIEILQASQFLRDTVEALPYRTVTDILHLQSA